MLNKPKLKVVELFGGIGAIRKALTRSGVDADYDYVEVDAKVVNAYNLIYNENFNARDVRDYQLPDEQIDLLFHGSPCQDFSVAGKQAGGDIEANTRSSLLWFTIDIILNAKVKPKIVIWENVKNVLSGKHRPVFDEYLQAMEILGYTNTYKVINAIDKGIPQRRERVFVVSIYQADKPFVFNDNKVPMRPISEFIFDNDELSLYLKQQSMKSAVLNGKIVIVDNYVQTITTKQWRWNNAGVLKVPFSTFNQENTLINVAGGGFKCCHHYSVRS